MMAIPHQLTVFGQSINRPMFPNRLIAFDVIERPAVENKVTAVDPALAGFRLFIEVGDLVSGKSDSSETSGRTNRRDGGDLSMSPMELK